jgi:hypothetical protein
LIREYSNWIKELGVRLAVGLNSRQIDTGSLPFLGIAQPEGSMQEKVLAGIVEELRQTEQRNLRTVLIFDQFEEFFFVYPDPIHRRQFFEFLGQCLEVLSVKVILSLREDYLHYLLECSRLSSIKTTGIDISAAMCCTVWAIFLRLMLRQSFKT